MNNLLKNKKILIADYGRSGQGWLSYMLCYYLNARFIEPYDLLRGRLYSSSDMILKTTEGDLPLREKTAYDLVIKTHEYPAADFKLTNKVIILTRDPKDVAVSAFNRYKNLSKKENPRSLKEAISMLIYSFRFTSYMMTAYKWSKYYSAWKNISAYTTSYEKLITDPTNTLKNILNYLEVKIDESLINETIEKYSFENITGRKRGEEAQDNSEFRKGIIGDYKNHFNSIELYFFNNICGNEMKHFSYD